MEAAYSTLPPGTAYYGHPVRYEFDPKKAHALLQEAGCLPCDVTFVISTSGSGQMQPLPMNELVKAELEEVGFRVKLDVMDWNALGQVGRDGIDKHPDDAAINASKAVGDPFYGLIRHVSRGAMGARRQQLGPLPGRRDRDLVGQITAEFDPAKRNALLTKLNERMNDQAVMIWVAHDVNPRALSPKLHGFVQAQSWFQDLTPITVDPYARAPERPHARLHPPPHPVRHPDRAGRQRGVLLAGVPGAGRPVADGAAAGRHGGDDRHRQARLRLRPADPGAIRDLAVARAARRFRPLHRHPARRHAGGVRLGRQHRHAGAVRGAGVVRASASAWARWRAASPAAGWTAS